MNLTNPYLDTLARAAEKYPNDHDFLHSLAVWVSQHVSTEEINRISGIVNGSDDGDAEVDYNLNQLRGHQRPQAADLPYAVSTDDDIRNESARDRGISEAHARQQRAIVKAVIGLLLAVGVTAATGGGGAPVALAALSAAGNAASAAKRG